MTSARVALVGVLLAAGYSALGASTAAATPVAPPSYAAELSLSKTICGAAGFVNKTAGIECGGLARGGALIEGGKQLITGNVGGAASTLVGAGAGTLATAGASAGLAVMSSAVVGAAGEVLHETAGALSATTSPQLRSTWFSSTYWRMAAIATLLTLPFLFAATVQAAFRSDVALLAKAALGYLPLALLSIAIAAPLTTLLLAASDELCSLISAAAANQSAHVLVDASVVVGGLTGLGQPVLVFLLGLFTIIAAFGLWIELLLREAAVYVVVLMLPLAFAALAWPARRIWALRAVEILVALILSKFAIVAVLSLGGAAIAASVGHADVSGLMAGTVLIMLAALSPWALLRFVPLAEVASGASAALRGEVHSAAASADRAISRATGGDDWVPRTIAWMSRQAGQRTPDAGDTSGSAGGGGGDGGGGGGDGGGGGADEGRTATETSEAPDPARSEPRWSEHPVFELGPNFRATPVRPNPEAE